MPVASEDLSVLDRPEAAAPPETRDAEFLWYIPNQVRAG